MTRYLLLLLPLLGFATAIKVEHATLQPLGQILHTNAKITQLSSQKQEIVSRLGGHVEAYYVKDGQAVKQGDKVVLIESIDLSTLSADYLALKQQMSPAQAQVNTTRKLYKKGLASKNQLSSHLIALERLRAQKNALSSRLQTLGIDANKLTKATDKFTLKAHADGVVGKILVSLHANVDAQTPLMTLVQENAYYATAFLSPKDAMQITSKTQAWIDLAGKTYPCHFVQLLPNIDEETQRAKVLFSIEKSPSNLLLGAFTQMDISLAPTQKQVMVKRTALSLYKGEWVVFTPKEHEEAEHHDETSEHDHDNEKAEHDAHDHEAHDTDKEHDDDEGHSEHEEHEEAPYTAKVVEIIAYAGEYLAVRGLEKDEEYVCDGVYFVKSMILKSSLGEHGH